MSRWGSRIGPVEFDRRIPLSIIVFKKKRKSGHADEKYLLPKRRDGDMLIKS